MCEEPEVKPRLAEAPCKLAYQLDGQSGEERPTPAAHRSIAGGAGEHDEHEERETGRVRARPPARPALECGPRLGELAAAS